MLLSNTVILKTKYNYNIDYYNSLGYNTQNETFEVNIDDLLKNSFALISASCDYCNKIEEITYYKWCKSMESPIKKYCCINCKGKKTKESNLLIYGVTNVNKLEITKEKIKQTNLENFGVEWGFQSEEIKNKIRQTNLDTIGVENPMQSNSIKNKQKETTIINWGVDNISKSEEIKEKKKKTTFNNWGVEIPLQSNEIKEKAKRTNLNKYGVEFASQSNEFKEKLKIYNIEKYGFEYLLQTNYFKEKSKKVFIDKYGVDNPSKSEEIKNKKIKTCLLNLGVDNPFKSKYIKNKIIETSINKYGNKSYIGSEIYYDSTIIGNDINHIKYIGNNIHLFKCENGHTFEINQLNYHGRIKNKTPLCTVCNPINDSKSIKEKDLFTFIESIYTSKIITSYRDGLEIDIYLPELKLGFEFNGLYWHSEEYKNKNYHLNKTNYFKERGIRIIHIWEDDWDNKRDILKSQIKNWLGITENKIFARKCTIKEVDKIGSKFLNNNHIQGTDRSNIKIGLYYENKLVSIMTFNRLEGRDKMLDYEWNLSRFCNKLNTNVVGGASKLFMYFIKNYNPTRIISYADKDWSDGNLYNKLGFNNIKESSSDYKYIINNRRINKSRYRKSVTGLTESKLNLLKIWDCGKIKFEYILKNI